MKIAIALSDIKSTGGVARVVTNIANSLVKVPGYDVEIISCFKSIRENVSYNIDDNIKIRYVNLDMNVKKNKLMKQIYFIKEIRSILKYSNSDVLISTNAHLNIYSIIATLGLKTKVIGSEHGAYNHLSIGWRILTQVFYRYLDKLILLTSKEKHKYKLKENKIAIIPNMIDNSNKKLSSLNNNNIVMVNRIDDNKNIFVALEVFSKVLKNNNNYKLNIYGECLEEDLIKLKNKIKELSIDGNVNINNFSDDIEQVYLKSDILLLTSKSEGFPMVLVEAMNYGIPCISFDILTGPSDIIIDGVNGYLIKPFDVDDMAKKLNYLISNRDKLMDMGINSKKSVERFNEKNIVKRWIDIIN